MIAQPIESKKALIICSDCVIVASRKVLCVDQGVSWIEATSLGERQTRWRAGTCQRGSRPVPLSSDGGRKIHAGNMKTPDGTTSHQ
jgi:hypothetical protein